MQGREQIPEDLIRQARDRVSIVDVASRHVEWDKRKSAPGRGDFWACCPFHDERSASFHVRESTGTFKCFGCGAGGDVIELIMHLERLTFPAAVRKLTGAESEPQERRYAPRRAIDDMPDVAKQKVALAIWDASEPAAGTLAEAYLRARGIGADLGAADLRFHAQAPEGYKLKRGEWAAMVAAIRSPSGDLIGAHMTYLLPDGSWKRPSVEHFPDRRFIGNAAGGFVRLGTIGPRICVGEGIESSLSASEISGRPAIAALSKGNMAALSNIDGVTDWLIAHDRGALDEARALARRLLPYGVTLRAFPPPLDCSDWNDASQARRA